ncbi:hypothetical protein LLEC1_05878 [Akanthomyces lecanii]|uniref:Beta-lactamase-related domain-containing protein n=1 Tax=Cordyceps confragosa TaxID=2714763 RepID=A0A179I626_CORDF|nr:hypothetical protein LLEC1_05878 [Akanthomyces lecanii]
MSCITAEDRSLLQSTIDSYTVKRDGVPGLVCSVVNANGDIVFESASGTRAAGSALPMSHDTVFWIASCTKLVTAIAAMQLVEQGRLALDDGDELETHLPELQNVKVLEETPDGSVELVDKKRKITLRMLLSHTDGTRESDIFGQPLVHQPGDKWEYGVSMDWVGRLIERVAGTSLGDYFEQHICTPLKMQSTKFCPTADMKANLAFMHERTTDGRIQLRDNGHVLSTPLRASAEEQASGILHSGGGGLFSTPSDYCQIIATVLNHGKHPNTGHRLLKRETLDEMLRNQIPEHPNFARSLPPAAKPSFVNSAPEIYPQPESEPQGWGLSFFKLLSGGPTGRSAGSVWWSGLANLVWWADVENGIGGLFASQILPFGDAEFFTCQTEVEALLYSALSTNGKIAAANVRLGEGSE